MDTNKNKRTPLDKLDKVELQMITGSSAYAMQFLKEEGFDLAKEAEVAEQYMKKIRFLAQAITSKERNQKLFELAYTKVKVAIQENAQKTTEILISLLQSKTPAVQYRKLEKWTDDEIREVLADIDLVQLMEKIEKEDQ